MYVYVALTVTVIVLIILFCSKQAVAVQNSCVCLLLISADEQQGHQEGIQPLGHSLALHETRGSGRKKKTKANTRTKISTSNSLNQSGRNIDF